MNRSALASGSRTPVLAVLLAACSLAACRSTAAAFLDLPEPTPTAESADPGGATAQQVPELPPPAIESLAEKDTILALLPRDNAGYIDWVKAVDSGVIRPRPGASGTGSAAPLDGFAFDFFFQATDPSMDAWFPHSAHVKWLDCESCHAALFPYRGAEVTMAKIGNGEQCGACHGSVAFPVDDCERCHTRVQMPAERAEPRWPLFTQLRRETNPDGGGISDANVPVAGFPHGPHRTRYRCSACHPQPFETRAGAVVIKMVDISDGKYCGECHVSGGEAFPALQCNRCHTAGPDEGNGPSP